MQDFDSRKSELLRSDADLKAFGIRQMAQFRTKGGISDLISLVFLVDALDGEQLEQMPDHVLSDTIDKNLAGTIVVCAHNLRDSKYFPDSIQTSIEMRNDAPISEVACISGWEKYDISGYDGANLYTEEFIQLAKDAEQDPLAQVLFLIVHDICEDGKMLSPDWYNARILLEYYRDTPIPADNSFLIGELFKELCLKISYEVDLVTYYRKLTEDQDLRRKGAKSTQRKAEIRRENCVELFAEMAAEQGPRLMMAPDGIKANALRDRAVKKFPDDFVRAGKPYSVEWFLRNIIEDRKLEIVEQIEASSRK